MVLAMAIVKVYVVRAVNLHVSICMEIHAQQPVLEDAALLAREPVCTLVMVAVFIQVYRLRIQYYKVSIWSSFDAWKEL